ncbi:RNA polymerase sigma factor [Rapidithrix thailandica]|uniref:RNA polymerase sigma factor n=1 Tax=Rapidithrix thailandica TaxID=413964 RepID=A0AAW9RQP0_9BACT
MALRKGNKSAFDTLYQKYFPLLYGYGLHFTSDKALIKDCLQDLFVDLYVKRNRLTQVTYVKSYLFQILRRTVLKKREQPPYEYSELTPGIAVSLSHEQELILGQLEKDKQVHLQNALQQLTAHQREALFLRFYQNLDYRAIAEIMDLKEVKSARTLIYRSLTVLKEYLKKKETSLTLY